MIGAILKSLGRQYMDVRLRSGPYQVRIMERPGRWMEDADLDQLSADLRRVASATLAEGSLTYGVFSPDRARFSHTVVTLVTQTDGTPVGFNALALMEVETEPRPTLVLHLGLVMVDPNARSKSLSWVLYGLTCFLLFFKRQFRPLWISNVTQVPAVVGMVSEMFTDIYPQPGDARRSLSHLLIARGIMARHRHVFGVGEEAGFDEERFVITDAYTGGSDDLKKSFDDAAKHRDEAYNSFCNEVLDYGRGDDVIQLGRLDLPAIRRYLARSVPKTRVAGLVLTGGVVALQRLILPVLHWSDSRRPYSILRPAKGADDRAN